MFEVQAIELIAKHLRGAVKDKNTTAKNLFNLLTL